MDPNDKTARSEAARALGRRGGLKGGKARAASLSPKRRSEIARMGAAKINEALAALSPDARRRLIMRRRTYSAYLLGREAGRVDVSAGEAANPYPRVKFQAQLHDAWLKGFRTAPEPATPFYRWRPSARKGKP